MEILISKNIKWVEFANQGVSRGIVNRNNWDKNWFTYINSPLINNVFTVNIQEISQWLLSAKLEHEVCLSIS